MFERSLETEEEVAGCFEERKVANAMPHTELVFAKLSKTTKKGFEGGDWVASTTKDARYTWHTHPICYGDSESPSNHGSSVFASGEDLVGLVQDDRRNRHFLSNPKGLQVFDCI